MVSGGGALPRSRHRDVKKEHDFLIILLVLFLTIQLAVVLILLFRPPQDTAPSAS